MAGLGRILCAEQEFGDGWEKLKQELPPDGEKGECGSWKPTAFLEEETRSTVQGSWLYRSTSAVVVFIPHCRFMVESSQFGLLLCGEDPLGCTGGRSRGWGWRSSGASSAEIRPARGNTAGMQTYLSNYCRSLLGNESLFLRCPSTIPSLTCWSHVENPLCSNLEGTAQAGARGAFTELLHN